MRGLRAVGVAFAGVGLVAILLDWLTDYGLFNAELGSSFLIVGIIAFVMGRARDRQRGG
ncbi:MAG: hypothetical protein ACXVEI_11460 [Actinomycetota bacterium]